MLKLIIIVIIVAVIFFKVKENKEFKEYQEKKQAEYEEKCRERKKNGEPSICEALPGGIEDNTNQTVTGPDGKLYPDTDFYDLLVIKHNFSESYDDYKYEFSPVFCMLASERYIAEFVRDLRSDRAMLSMDIETGIACIFELAENYAYPVPVDNDLTQAEYYTIRYLKDRHRAMEGNGYYKNAYGFPVNMEKALYYYELPEQFRVNFTEKISQIGNSYVFLMVKCWMQTAHIYSSGMQGIRQDVQKAKQLYSQVFQMAMHYSLEDVAFGLIHALLDGFPRNPADYENIAYNMLADWACRSDFGLALYVEYILYVNELDKSVLMQSPEKVIRMCREQAEANHYAAYLLGRGLLYGYGTPKDETLGRELIELAASDGCVSALYLLTQLSIGNPEDEKKWKAALDKTVTVITEKCGYMRNVLEQNGKSVTKQRFEEIQSKLAEETAMKLHRQASAQDVNEQIPSQVSEPEQAQSFNFPQFIYDGDENPWELMNSGWDNANYYCQKTGETRSFYASDFEYGAPSGFHLR